MKPDIIFYCGINEKFWNYHPAEPGAYACIAPVTTHSRIGKNGKKSRVLRRTQALIDPKKTKHILVDSGAFSEEIELDSHGKIVVNKRLSFDDALERQITHARDFLYSDLVSLLVSYDWLIDEVWKDGIRSKARWSFESAETAVNETIKAAQYLSTQRERVNRAFGHPVHLVLSAQGVEAQQYRRCAEEIVKVMEPNDVFGLGGWCISGLRRHEMLPAAALILPGVFEVLGQANVRRVHVFGVIFPGLLGFLLYLCEKHGGIQLSTDSSGPCREPAQHGRWGYGSWTDPSYQHHSPKTLESCKTLDAQGNRAPSCSPGTFCKGFERARHVLLTSEYLAHFREREPDLVAPLPTPQLQQLTFSELLIA